MEAWLKVLVQDLGVSASLDVGRVIDGQGGVWERLLDGGKQLAPRAPKCWQ